MDVYAISDWHLSLHNPKPMDIFGGAWENYVEDLERNLRQVLHDDSILLIAGDISWAMHLENAKPDLDYIASFPGKKVILRGNHDYWWKSVSAVRSIVGTGMFVLQNDSVKIGDVVIAGSRGWDEDASGSEDEKIYRREVLRMKMSLDDAIKKRQEGDRLVVMTHYPPFLSQSGSPVTESIRQARADAVVYGHIHGRNYKKSTVTEMDGIPYYLTSCDILQNMPVKVL